MTGYRRHIVKSLFLIAFCVPLSVDAMWKQILAKKLEGSGSGKKPSAAPDMTETVDSLTQCVILCNNKNDDCKSIGYAENQCYIFKKLYPDSELESAKGYSYFEPTPVAIAATYYKLFAETVPYNDASEKCKALDTNARLACIHDEETNKKIVAIIKANTKVNDVWIGLKAKTITGPFVWTDGVEISPDKKGYWHNWLYKDPDDYKKGIEDSCVRILTSSRGNSSWFTKWADTKNCTAKHSYMCEIRVP